MFKDLADGPAAQPAPRALRPAAATGRAGSVARAAGACPDRSAGARAAGDPGHRSQPSAGTWDRSRSGAAKPPEPDRSAAARVMSLAGARVAISAHRAGQPDGLRALLTGARTIAVVGASDEPWRPSFGIMRYLQRAGYKIIPVN